MNQTVTILVGPAEHETATGLTALAINPTELEIDTGRLSEQLAALVRMVEEAGGQPDGRYEVSEVHLDLALSASGKLSLLGSGAVASANATVRVVIRRKPSDPQSQAR